MTSKEWNDAHKEERRLYSKKYYQEHKAEYRLRDRKRLGVKNPTGESKVGPCEICTKVRRLVYDHDHDIGVFRGWLCTPCNTKVEWYLKNKERIEKYV